MELGFKNENIKKVHELAYQTGKALQSKETGFLHLSYSIPEDQQALSIPVLENILFALSLLRTKTQESVLEAKDLLTKILHFQAPTGNFPTYLHEFPTCQNYFIGADILLAFYWILHDFSSVLGESLKNNLKQSAFRLLEFNLESLETFKPNTVIQLKIAASAMEFGKQEESKNILQFLSLESELFWYIPEQLGEALLALQMLKNFPIEKLFQTWHLHLLCYVGPAIREYHRRNHKESTLYDLFMAALVGKMHKRNDDVLPYHLKAALIQPIDSKKEDFIETGQYYGKVLGKDFQTIKEENYAFSFIRPIDALSSKGFHPFYFIWGNGEKQNSLVMQNGNWENIHFSQGDKEIQLLIDLKSPPQIDDRDESKEICFFTEIDSNTQIFVNHQKSTTFLLNQTVSILHPLMNMTLTFSIEKGEGLFKGHLMRANRPSQKHILTKDRFSAYDWQISLRTLKRSEPCQIKVKINYLPPHG